TMTRSTRSTARWPTSSGCCARRTSVASRSSWIWWRTTPATAGRGFSPRAPHGKYHDWYSWATPSTDLKAISATGGFAWHALPDGQNYLGVFTGEMPDLNYDDPAVRKAMIDVGRFWLKKGVDGFRLDAAQHVYLDFETDWGSATVLQKN